MSGTPEGVDTPGHGLAELFGGLEAQIEALVAQHKSELGRFLSGFGTCVDIARRAQADLDRIAATRFSVFPYFTVRELDLSRTIGDLLDPSGPHGQRERFLRLFLDMLAVTAADPVGRDARRCRVALEYPTATGDKVRYIDIVLHVRGGVWMGIENKPWAADQPHQIGDYLRDMRARAERDEAQAWVVYLSGDGTAPAEWPDLEPDDRDRCLIVPYRSGNGARPSLERWVERCAEACEADRVRWFLKELLAYVRREFRNAESQDDSHEEKDECPRT